MLSVPRPRPPASASSSVLRPRRPPCSVVRRPRPSKCCKLSLGNWRSASGLISEARLPFSMSGLLHVNRMAAMVSRTLSKRCFSRDQTSGAYYGDCVLLTKWTGSSASNMVGCTRAQISDEATSSNFCKRARQFDRLVFLEQQRSYLRELHPHLLLRSNDNYLIAPASPLCSLVPVPSLSLQRSIFNPHQFLSHFRSAIFQPVFSFLNYCFRVTSCPNPTPQFFRALPEP